jgi:hypothetical protein
MSDLRIEQPASDPQLEDWRYVHNVIIPTHVLSRATYASAHSDTIWRSHISVTRSWAVARCAHRLPTRERRQ